MQYMILWWKKKRWHMYNELLTGLVVEIREMTLEQTFCYKFWDNYLSYSHPLCCFGFHANTYFSLYYLVIP